MILPITDFSQVIPPIWKDRIDNKGRVYLSDKTIEEMDKQALHNFLTAHNLCLHHIKGGAWMRVKEGTN